MKCIGIPFIWGPICKSNINSFAKCSQPLNSTPHKYTEPHKTKNSLDKTFSEMYDTYMSFHFLKMTCGR